MDTYESQKKFFEAAYRSGEHGWPVSGPSLAVTRFLSRFQSERSTGRVLDIGCGEGRHAALFARAGYQTIGLDYQPLALARAIRFLKSNGSRPHFVQADVFHLPFRGGQFDLLLDYGCLHHVRKRDTKAYLESVIPLLKPGGYFLLACFSEHFKHYPGEHRTLDWVLHRGHYDRFFRAESFQQIFGKDFKILEVEEEREELDAFYHVLMQKKAERQV